MTDEEKTQFNSLQTQINGFADTIKAAEGIQNRAAVLDAPADPVIRPSGVVVGRDLGADRKFSSLGEQLRAIIDSSRLGGSIDPRLTARNAVSGLGEGVPSDGGFLVQQDFTTELLKRIYETGILASKCRKIPISPMANGLRMNAIDETSRANGSRWGGVQAYWENEADATTETKPKFRKMELTLNKLMGLCYATDELLQDTEALESVITQAFTEEFAFKVDDAIFRGTGAGQPLGLLNANCLVTVPKETGQAADTLIAENIFKIWQRMWPKSRANSVWLINSEVEPQMSGLSLSVGTGGVPVYLPAGGLSAAPYGQLFGRPVIPIEQASALGDVGDIVLADLSQYIIIDKGGMQSASSIHVRFLNDEQVFRFIYRISGQPLWNSPLTPYKGSSAQSPFVTLAAR
jgi:HK97 family phage major capsid protein